MVSVPSGTLYQHMLKSERLDQGKIYWRAYLKDQAKALKEVRKGHEAGNDEDEWPTGDFWGATE